MKSTHSTTSTRAHALPTTRRPSKVKYTGEQVPNHASTSKDVKDEDDCTAFQTFDLQRTLPKVHRNPPRHGRSSAGSVKKLRRHHHHPRRRPIHVAAHRVERRHATRLSRSPLTESQRQRLQPLERRNATVGLPSLVPPRGLREDRCSKTGSVTPRGSFRSSRGSFHLPRRPGQVLHPNDVQELQTFFRQSF